MRHRSIQALYSYWDHLRGDRPAPTRAELDPRGIAAELGDVFLLDGTVDDFRFRLAGSRMVALLGHSLTGLGFDRIWLESARDNAFHALAGAAEEGEPVLMGVRAFGASGQPGANWPNRRDPVTGRPERRREATGAGEMLLLPMRHQNRLGGRILGAFALFSPPPLPPREAQLLDVSGTRVLGRAARPAPGTGLLPGHIAENVIGRRGHLTLMRGFLETSEGPDTPGKGERG